MNRSSRSKVFCKKNVLQNFAKFTGKHLCQSFFFNKVAGLRPATSLKKRLWYRCFFVNFTKFLRTFFLQNTSGRLLLNIFKKTIFHGGRGYKGFLLLNNLKFWMELRIYCRKPFAKSNTFFFVLICRGYNFKKFISNKAVVYL